MLVFKSAFYVKYNRFKSRNYRYEHIYNSLFKGKQGDDRGLVKGTNPGWSLLAIY